MCQEWLGGLTPQKYKSDIVKNQLGRHLDALVGTELIRSYAIEKKKDGRDFKIVFRPGEGFFQDYEAYYVRRERPRRTRADELIDEVCEPVQVVALFHERLGHEHSVLDEEKETDYAKVLLREHSLQEVRDLTEYAVGQIKAAGFDTRETRWFNVVKGYRVAWQADQRRRRLYEKRQADIAACPDCNDKGMVIMRSHSGATTAVPCPHDGELLMAYEERENLRRMPS
jgi:hypothetical protein